MIDRRAAHQDPDLEPDTVTTGMSAFLERVPRDDDLLLDALRACGAGPCPRTSSIVARTIRITTASVNTEIEIAGRMNWLRFSIGSS